MSANPRTLLQVSRILHSWVMVVIVAVAAAYAGSHLLAELDRFDIDRGDRMGRPHDHYLYVLVDTGDGHVRVIAYSELAALRTRYPEASVQLGADLTAVTLNTPRKEARLDYQIALQDDSALLVETRYSDSEWTIAGRYRVDGEQITPLYCRYWNSWRVAEALLYFSLPAALLVWLLGRLLRKHEESVLLARGERPYLQHRYRLS